MTQERWRPVLGYEGLYEVSDHGLVRGVARTLSDGRRWKSSMCRQKTGTRGHKSVRLCGVDGHKFRGVHVLVLEAFVCPKPGPNMQGAHNDGNPANNHVSNLRWDTVKGNHADKKRHGTLLFGERNPLAKLTHADVENIRSLAHTGVKGRELARRFGVTPANISAILNRKTWCQDASLF